MPFLSTSARASGVIESPNISKYFSFGMTASGSFEQGGDEPEPGQMGAAVNPYTATLFGRGEQALLLIRADVADGGAGFTRQFVDGEFLGFGGAAHGGCS